MSAYEAGLDPQAPEQGLDADSVSRDAVARVQDEGMARGEASTAQIERPLIGADGVSRDSRVLAYVAGNAPGELEHHPLAALFPLLEGRAFEEFNADIAMNGLREPIVLYERKVLDGRNRLRACIEIGTEPVFIGLGDGDPLVRHFRQPSAPSPRRVAEGDGSNEVGDARARTSSDLGLR
jgi:hypothetical protein